MKLSRQIICFSMALCLLFISACSGGNKGGDTENPSARGRYVESDITPPIDGQFSNLITQDGVIVCFNEGLKTRCESSDGGNTWNMSPGPGANTDRYRNVSSGTLMPDGSLLVFMQDEGLAMIMPDGESVPYPVDDIDKAVAEGETVMMSIIEVMGADRLLLSYTIGGVVMQSASRPAGGESSGDEPADGEPSDSEPSGGMTTGGEPSGSMMTGGGPTAGRGTRGTQQRPADGEQRYSAVIGGMSAKTVLLELGTGRKIKDIPVEGTASAASDGSSMYIMDTGGTVSVFSLSDGTASGNSGVRFWESANGGGSSMMMGLGGSGAALAIDGVGNMYAAHNGNLLMAGADGNVSTALESTAYSIGAPRMTVSSVFALPDGSIIVETASGMQSGRLYKYVWDENAVTDPDKVISVWSLEDNSLVRAAIAEFRKKVPSATINYEVALDGNSAVSVSDAIKTLNTRLLGDSGPDIVILDGCPAESYAARGMLLDIGGLADTGGIYENLLAPYSADGGVWFLPAQFMMPVLMGNADALSKAQTLGDLVRLVVSGNDTPAPGNPGSGPFTALSEGDRPELYFENVKELHDLLWPTCAPVIVSDNKLDTDALKSYIEAMKAISDKYGLADESRSGGRSVMRIGFSDGGSATAIPGSLVYYTTEMANYGAFAAGNLQLLQMMMERTGSELSLLPGLVSGVWVPSTVVGVSADAKSPELAAEFIQAMLSLEVQRLNYGTGLPVTRAGMAAQIDAINERLAESDRGIFTIDADALIGQLRVPAMSDTVLTDMMWDSIDRCMRGELDVEGAVRAIEQNIKNYLAERQ